MPRAPLPPQDPFAASYRPPPSPTGAPAEWPEQRPSRNGLGIAGFIVSIVGVLSCGCLSPIGGLLSLVAVFRRPRGFAIAGVIIGALGTVLLAFVGYVVVSMGVLMGQPFQDGMLVSDQLKEYRRAHAGATPQGWAELTGRDEPMQDEWGNAYHYRVLPDGKRIELASDGPDGQPKTTDDVRILIEDELVVAYRGRPPFWVRP